ncbi:hypothetical protein EJB05_09174, partial [Eragrostis curvula]
MEDWVYYSLSITLCLALSYHVSSGHRAAAGKPPSLPPGPSGLSLLVPFLFMGWTSTGMELIFRAARSWYGPVFTLNLLPHPVVFIADRCMARRGVRRQAAARPRHPDLLQRPAHRLVRRYGPVWRALRRNLAGKVLHLLRRHAAVRRDAVTSLVAGVRRKMTMVDDGAVVVVEGLLHEALLRVMIRMCFGDGAVASVAALQRELLTSVIAFQVFGVVPAVTRLLYRRRWKRMLAIRRRQKELFIPLIRARRRRDAGAGEMVECYADSLLGLRIPGEDGGGRSLTEREMVSLCNEFLSSGTDSTVAVMQWAMANLVTRPEIQAKLRAEILDGGAAFDGFAVPRHGHLYFAVGDMAMDEAVWAAPATEFRPERFLPGGEGEDVDLTGTNKEIKMMPFGAGRRVCPAIDAALLHLQYFLANLVREFQWTEVPGEAVDFAERQDMSVVMRRPLRAKVVPCSL